jgi:ABC-type glycerol-3-phosphate transport system substrate-binding protein
MTDRFRPPLSVRSRRVFLAGALASLTALATACHRSATAAGATAVGSPAPAAAVRLRLFDGAPNASAAGQLLGDFRARQPAIEVAYQNGGALNRLRPALAAALAAGAAPDVWCLPSTDLAAFVADGHLRDLTGLPGAAALQADELPFVAAQTHVAGRRYGVAGWVGLRCFMDNGHHLAKVGLPQPPRTYDDLQRAGVAFQQDRVGNYAFFWPYATGAGFFAEDYVANERIPFDTQLNPRFLADPLYAAILEWRLAAFYTWKIVDPRCLSLADVDDNFPQGWVSFTWADFDALKTWQNPLRYQAAGEITNVLVPSMTPGKHGTIGNAVVYAVAQTAQDPAAAWSLVQTLAGRAGGTGYVGARLRWQQEGLGFPYRSLLADTALLRAASGWADVSAYVAQLARAQAPPAVSAPWRAEWLSFANLQSSQLLQRDLTPAAYQQALGARWRSLQQAAGPSGWVPL